jgi:hypothetical protein
VPPVRGAHGASPRRRVTPPGRCGGIQDEDGEMVGVARFELATPSPPAQTGRWQWVAAGQRGAGFAGKSR